MRHPNGDMLTTITDLRRALAVAADPIESEPMAAYMQHRFEFLGVKTPARRAITKDLLRSARRATADELIELATRCWAQPEREWQYVGTDALKSGHCAFSPDHLDDLRVFITAKSWWDTVDAIASWPVGSIIDRHRDAATVMDAWLHDTDIWVARTAILHQLRFKHSTDVERQFRYALTRAGDTEFFIRKAIGWSLRQYAHTDPDPVVTFVERHHDELSALTRREALKNVR